MPASISNSAKIVRGGAANARSCLNLGRLPKPRVIVHVWWLTPAVTVRAPTGLNPHRYLDRLESSPPGSISRILFRKLNSRCDTVPFNNSVLVEFEYPGLQFEALIQRAEIAAKQSSGRSMPQFSTCLRSHWRFTEISRYDEVQQLHHEARTTFFCAVRHRLGLPRMQVFQEQMFGIACRRLARHRVLRRARTAWYRQWSTTQTR